MQDLVSEATSNFTKIVSTAEIKEKYKELYWGGNGVGDMYMIPPSTPGEYSRVLGHAYYQSATTASYWIMKFRPSNEWYVI